MNIRGNETQGKEDYGNGGKDEDSAALVILHDLSELLDPLDHPIAVQEQLRDLLEFFVQFSVSPPTL